MQPKDYILSRTEKSESGCWVWKGSVNNHGYGRIGSALKVLGERAAHRISYRAFLGNIPRDKSVLHRCDLRRCCNPEHLFLGTQAENVQDMISKSRHNPRYGEHNASSKLNRQSVSIIRSEWQSTTISELARRFGVSRRAVSFVIKGVTWN